MPWPWPAPLNRHLRPVWFFNGPDMVACAISPATRSSSSSLPGSTDADIVAATVGNFANPSDRGWRISARCCCVAITPRATRVDYTPDGLGSWGDGRLTILDRRYSRRKYIDIAGRRAIDHLFPSTTSRRAIDCSAPPAANLIDGVGSPKRHAAGTLLQGDGAGPEGRSDGGRGRTFDDPSDRVAVIGGGIGAACRTLARTPRSSGRRYAI